MPNSLFSKPVIGIDLGASYTKVSFRPGWKSGKRYEARSQLVNIDRDPLIPSLAILTRKGWIFGQEAAEYTPNPADQVYQNWKARIFSDSRSEDVDASLDAAGRFFEWLHGRLERARLPVSDSRIKVCLPAFANIEKPAKLLAGKMHRNGWQNSSVSRLEEPRANTLGIFGEGRNCLWQAAGAPEPNPVFRSMFPPGGPLLEHLYRAVMIGTNPIKKIAVVDVGSFTTDIGIVEIDARGDGDCIYPKKQESFDLGVINSYESPLLDALGKRHGFDPATLSFDLKEKIKADVSAGIEVQRLLPNGVRVLFGTRLGEETANGICADFANKVHGLIDRCVGDGADSLVFTGGGFSIKAFSEKLQKICRENGYVPYNPFAGQNLQRMATALGASSVLIDFPVTERIPDAPSRPSARDLNYAVCSCHGGNLSCMRCGGAGHYKTGG